MPITSPHNAPTFSIGQKGTAVVEQDSEEDLIARAKNVCVCPIGFREDNPEYGIPPLLFKTIPLDIAGVQAEVERWAEVDLTVSEHAEGLQTAIRNILAEVGP